MWHCAVLASRLGNPRIPYHRQSSSSASLPASSSSFDDDEELDRGFFVFGSLTKKSHTSSSKGDPIEWPESKVVHALSDDRAYGASSSSSPDDNTCVGAVAGEGGGGGSGGVYKCGRGGGRREGESETIKCES